MDQSNSGTTAAQQAAQSAASFQPTSAIHMTHMASMAPGPNDPYESCAIQFQLPNAIIWQIKFLLAGVQSKKSATTAATDFAALGEQFGRDFDKYLLQELIEFLDIREAVLNQAKQTSSKDKMESGKLSLLSQELSRASQKPEFLTYFYEIMQTVLGPNAGEGHYAEFSQELTRRLKLNAQLQILISLSLLESSLSIDEDECTSEEALKLFRQKLLEFFQNGKPDQLPEYAVHRILYLFDVLPELEFDPSLTDAKAFIVSTVANRQGQFVPLRGSIHQDISQLNSHHELPSFAFLREGGGLEHLETVKAVLQPWEILLDIGHNSTYMYDFLLKALSEFKSIDEKTMALTILHLAVNYNGQEDATSRLVYALYETNKDGNPAPLKKAPDQKCTNLSWSLDNLARVFRELYPTLNWARVSEAFSELEPHEFEINELSLRQFQTLLQLFIKSKPQNIKFPLQDLIRQQWKHPRLQLTFLENSMKIASSKKDTDHLSFAKLQNRAPIVPEFSFTNRPEATQQLIDVWTSVDLVERLILLSENRGLFMPVRRCFEHAIKTLPEYLTLSISLAKPFSGNIMVDELLSVLMPQFFGDHPNGITLLQNLYQCNKKLFIRSICEIAKHDQKTVNLNRILDITQEVKQSLIPIVYCEDYAFAVSLGILAGKRDFLHYEMWLKSRIKDIGSAFIEALLKWIEDNITYPVQDFTKRNAGMLASNPDQFESQKTSLLEKSHLTKEKLQMTMDHLRPANLQSNSLVTKETLAHITELTATLRELFPQQNDGGGSSDEIDAVANEHFQRVFSASDSEVDDKIKELIGTMKSFQNSQEQKEQEVYACMLHGLFDEYRFLHRYPQQYLTKIAKLFGAIIKNKLLDRVLQDIALKFVIEAFRRDGRRQKFGIIVIKSFIEELPQMPKFLEDIYNIRQSIANSEPEMMRQIEELYNKTKNQGARKDETPGAEPSPAVNQYLGNKIKETSDVGRANSTEQPQNMAADQKKKDKDKGQKQVQAKAKGKDKPKEVPAPDYVPVQRPGTLQPPARPFIPTKPPGNIPPQNFKNDQPGMQFPQPHGSLNLQAAEFQRPGSTSYLEGQRQEVSIHSREFTPSRPPLQSVRFTQEQVLELQQLTKTLQQKFKRAKETNSRVRLDDLIDDETIRADSETVEDIRIICNNTGKSNLRQKIDELKKFLVANKLNEAKLTQDERHEKAQGNLRWLLHYILSKRLGSQSFSLQPIYVDIIRELNSAITTSNRTRVSVLGLTLIQAGGIFKKCMLIDEEEFHKATSVAHGAGSIIKGYLQSLGTFIGSLTLAENEPIRANYLNLKQILFEGAHAKNSRFAVAFVCRILKESGRSQFFNAHNPWIGSLLSLLREIYEIQQGVQDITMEIDALFLHLGIQDIKPQGLLGEVYLNAANKRELDYLLKQTRIIMPTNANQSSVDVPKLDRQSGSEISGSVLITDELKQAFSRILTYDEQKIKVLVGKSVDDSIIEILPPVVDRSVTIALITTRELVLKDFAYDQDYKKVLEASDLIVQNLAGSLALVTCREPLRMSLTNNIKKALENHFRSQGFEIRSGLGAMEEKDQRTINEENISEIAVLVCRENLELGCKLIKVEVIEKALRKVREDITIQAAVDKRKRAEQIGVKQFKDEDISGPFNELPIQLRPNLNGLTHAQFQVYKDFKKLDQLLSPDEQLGLGDVDRSEGALADDQKNLQLILQKVDQNGLTAQNKQFLQDRLDSLSTKEDQDYLWSYLQRNLETVCKNFGNSDVEPILDVLSFIVTNYKAEDFSKKLLVEQFLRFDGSIFNDVDLNISLMNKGIISVTEWDCQLSHFFKESAAQLKSSELRFFERFLKTAIVDKKIIAKQDLPMMFEVIERLSTSTDTKIGNFCRQLLIRLGMVETLNQKQSRDGEQQGLVQLFIRWVSASYLEDKEAQEQRVNALFSELESTVIRAEPHVLSNFCRVIVRTSVDRALVTPDGQQLPGDLVDFRYIDSCVKLLMLLLSKFNFNKHEFMSKILELIAEKLDEDHRIRRAAFNQRPYYRILVNILTALNHSVIFNAKTQATVLHSFADLLRSLVPQLYPGFAFAWLELIGHKWFLPHFLKQAPDSQPSNAAITPQKLAQVIHQAQTQAPNSSPEVTFYQRRFKVKDLIISAFNFLKANIELGQNVPSSMQAFYQGCLRLINMIRLDYPEFLVDFHFNLVNCLPEQCIQMRNLILSAHPSNVQQPDPFSKNLKIDLLNEIQKTPRILSNYENYLQPLGLKEDLENYTRTKNQSLINDICMKMERSDEMNGILNGTRTVNSNVIGAVVLFIANWKANQQQTGPEATREDQRETREAFKAIVRNLGDEARRAFLNAIINELRYPNNHTFQISCIILYIYVEAEQDIVHEQMSSIFIERLQAQGPYPWGLMISFRELIQIPKFRFMTRPYIKRNFAAMARLFQGPLRNFLDFVTTQLKQQLQMGQLEE